MELLLNCNNFFLEKVVYLLVIVFFHFFQFFVQFIEPNFHLFGCFFLFLFHFLLLDSIGKLVLGFHLTHNKFLYIVDLGLQVGNFNFHV